MKPHEHDRMRRKMIDLQNRLARKRDLQERKQEMQEDRVNRLAMSIMEQVRENPEPLPLEQESSALYSQVRIETQEDVEELHKSLTKMLTNNKKTRFH